MLRFTKLDIENFGPYKGQQTIYFPKEDGVTIFFGENQRGKTSLLNSIRYALFGKALGRGSRELELAKLVNLESAAQGTYGFSVSLSFTYEATNYELTRMLRPKQGVQVPQEDSDFIQEWYLRKNGSVLGPDERDREMAMIMPEQISRFFLFDGELLQEYEELLLDDSETGQRISDAIEKILGVPIIINARSELLSQYKDAQRAESKAAQKNQKTKELGIHLDDLTKVCSHHEQFLEKLQLDLERLKALKASLEIKLKKSTQAKILLDEKESLENRIGRIEDEIKDKKLKIKETMKVAWRGLISRNVSAIRDKLQEEINIIQKKETEKAVAAGMMDNLQKALESGHCPTCFRELDDNIRIKLRSLIDVQDDPDKQAKNDRIASLTFQNQALRQFEVSTDTGLVKQLVSDIEMLTVDKASYEDRIQEINDETLDIDQAEVRKNFAEYDKVVEEISLVLQGIKKEDDELKNKRSLMEEIENELQKISKGSYNKELQRREMCKELYGLFNEGVAVYRDRLRKKVEEDATSLFVNLTTEQDYKGLQISDSYGLTILHKDGNPIPLRSAGAEHIVAMSLIGALQKNAPMRGPIIMDSSFTRLDEGHKTNVIKALPSMAPQVVLLVFESELNPRKAREELLGKLKAEFKLVRQSARHTTIGRMEEVS